MYVLRSQGFVSLSLSWFWIKTVALSSEQSVAKANPTKEKSSLMCTSGKVSPAFGAFGRLQTPTRARTAKTKELTRLFKAEPFSGCRG